jgi:uncharacterized SAM-binding protein YcdF (DUF218 family)
MEHTKILLNESTKRWLKISVLVTILLIAFFSIKNMGLNLVSKDKSIKSDLTFILLGPVPDRALLTADLYHQGQTEKILMANEYQAGMDLALAQRLHIEKTSDVFVKALLSLEVPANIIEVLPEVAASTRDEVIILKNYLEQHPQIKSVMVVTSSFHGLRAKKLFNLAIKGLNHEVQLVIPANPHSVFNAQKWWTDRYSATMVALEYLKLVNFYLNDQFTI